MNECSTKMNQTKNIPTQSSTSKRGSLGYGIGFNRIKCNQTLVVS